MTKDKKTYTIDDLIEKVSTYIDDEKEIELITLAYNFAKDKHEGRYRLSGEEHINHPLSIAIILTTVYSDAATICAGLLHDLMDEVGITRQELEDTFGK